MIFTIYPIFLPPFLKGGAVKGAFFRAFRLTTANAASAGAVAEALANDLTRAMGVQTQELSLVKGRYSDGHEKLMLVSKFANGYRDFDGNFLKDGRLVGRQDAHGNVIEQPEDIGRYKAMFLLLADRDAVGSHGQNKGNGLCCAHFSKISFVISARIPPRADKLPYYFIAQGAACQRKRRLYTELTLSYPIFILHLAYFSQ